MIRKVWMNAALRSSITISKRREGFNLEDLDAVGASRLLEYVANVNLHC